MHTDLISDINQSFEISLPVNISDKELKETLTQYVNHLINYDFEKLIFHLYRIDVNEAKMKQLLEQKNGENAAGLIADLIIERQVEKIKSCQQFRQRDNDISENEKW
jgi:hypothetical protein